MGEPHEFPDREMYLRSIAEQIKERLPKGCGFALWLFDFGDSGSLSYVSNAEREDMIKVAEEWLRKVRTHGRN